MIHEYRTLAGECQGLLKEKGSRFIAYAIPVRNEQEVHERLTLIRAEHHSARHVCYAYMLEPDASVWRANDDGEPSGTGGRPILAALRSNELTHVLIAVVRYFGGIKLGVPGLIAAYRGAAEDAIAQGRIVVRTVEQIFSLRFDYAVQHEVAAHVKSTEGQLLRESYEAFCEITVAWPAARVEEASRLLESVVLSMSEVEEPDDAVV